MPFKIPRPTYDPELVEEIEDYLNQLEDTVIVSYGIGPDDWEIQHAAGTYKRHHGRPMFQTFHDGVASSVMKSYPDPCPDCDDWSRTSRCAVHYEKPWDDAPKTIGFHSPDFGESILDRLYSEQRAWVAELERQSNPIRGYTVTVHTEGHPDLSWVVQSD